MNDWQIPDIVAFQRKHRVAWVAGGRMGRVGRCLTPEPRERLKRVYKPGSIRRQAGFFMVIRKFPDE